MSVLSRFWQWIRRRQNFWIVLGLLLANIFAWGRELTAQALPEVTPRLDPQLVEIREKVWSGEASGETFSILVTEEMASEAMAWFLEQHPEIPFSHPQVEFDPQGATGRGLVHLFGLRTPVYGRVRIWVEDGRPGVEIVDVGVAGATAPDFLLDAVQGELQTQIQAAQNLAVILTRIELGQGYTIIEGVYR